MTSKFELFSKKKIKDLYLTESMQKHWLHMLDEYWHEKYTPLSNDFDFWLDWLFQYYN